MWYLPVYNTRTLSDFDLMANAYLRVSLGTKNGSAPQIVELKRYILHDGSTDKCYNIKPGKRKLPHAKHNQKILSLVRNVSTVVR